MAATSRVPDRTSRSWPPPCRTAVRTSLPTGQQRADPVRSAELVRGEAQQVETACREVDGEVTDRLDRVTVRDRAVLGGQPRRSGVTGCNVPTSLFAHITDTSAVSRSTASASAPDRSDRVGRPGRSSTSAAPSCASQPTESSTA